MRLLDIRSFELKSEVHAVFDRVWKELVQVDIATGQVAIYNVLKGRFSALADMSCWTD
jgi:centromere/kinetochore protein ZW10